MSISFKVLQDTIHAVQSDYMALKRDLLKTKIIFLQLADNQSAMLAAMKAANINVELKSAITAEDAPSVEKP